VAGVTVQKAIPDRDRLPCRRLLEIGTDPDFIYEPELAEDIRLATVPGKY
jgi:hypothetical protein